MNENTSQLTKFESFYLNLSKIDSIGPVIQGLDIDESQNYYFDIVFIKKDWRFSYKSLEKAIKTRSELLALCGVKE